MSSPPSLEKIKEWAIRAARKRAIVPHYFEVFPTKVILICGKCEMEFTRTLIPNLDEPVFVCPNEECRARNWVPVRFNFL